MKLKSGDTVDIIAPSSPPKNNKWKKGFELLRSWGLKPRIHKEAIDPWMFHANSHSKRLALLKQAFSNKDSSAVWMLRGGYGLQKILPALMDSYSRRFQKKLFIGYSDATALHLFLNSKKQKTLHAPMVSELSGLPKVELGVLKDLLFGKTQEMNFEKLNMFKKRSPIILKAPIYGGNLSLLSSSVGTPWYPKLPPHFLFLEDVDEKDYKLDKMLHHLLYSGYLKNVKALLFGNFHPLTLKSFPSKVLTSFSKVSNIPMVFGMPCGHKKKNYPLPLASPSELSIQGERAFLKIKI